MLSKSKMPKHAPKGDPPKSDKKPNPKDPRDAKNHPQQPQGESGQHQQNPKTTPAQGQQGQGSFSVNDFFGKDKGQQQPVQGGDQSDGTPQQSSHPNQPHTKPNFDNYFGTHHQGGNSGQSQQSGSTQPHSQPSNANPLGGGGPRPTMPVLPVNAVEKQVEKEVKKQVEK